MSAPSTEVDLASPGEKEGVQCSETVAAQESTSRFPPRKSFSQRLAIFSGTYTNESLALMLIKPFLILANPAVIWSTITLAMTTCWFVVVSFVIAQIFYAPPFLLDSAQIGYLSAGPVIGGTLGCVVAGLISDPLVEFLAKKNRGIYEPEFRLLLAVPMLIFGAVGFFLFGHLIMAGKSPASAAVAWGLALVSMQFCSVTVGTYMVDAYRNITVEVFIIGMVVKNFTFFGFSHFMNNWVSSWGPAKVFNCIAGIQIGICLLSIPMWIFGKKCRASFHSRFVGQSK